MAQNRQWCLLRDAGGLQGRYQTEAERLLRRMFRKPPDEARREAERGGIWINPEWGGYGRTSWDDLPKDMRTELEEQPNRTLDTIIWPLSCGNIAVFQPVMNALQGLLGIRRAAGSFQYGKGFGPGQSTGGGQSIHPDTHMACLFAIEPGPDLLERQKTGLDVPAVFRDAVLEAAPRVWGRWLACLSMHLDSGGPVVLAAVVPEYKGRLSKAMFTAKGAAAKWKDALNQAVGAAVEAAGRPARGNEGMEEKHSAAEELLRQRDKTGESRCVCRDDRAEEGKAEAPAEPKPAGRSTLEQLFADAMKDAGADPDLIGSALAALAAKKDFEPACISAARAMDQKQCACFGREDAGRDADRSFEEDLLADDDELDRLFGDGSERDNFQSGEDLFGSEEEDYDEDESEFGDEEDIDKDDGIFGEDEEEAEEEPSGDEFIEDGEEDDDIFADAQQECACACHACPDSLAGAVFRRALQPASAPRQPLLGLAAGDAGLLAGPKGVLAALAMQLAVSAASGRDLSDPDGFGKGLCGSMPMKTFWLSCGAVRFRGERLLAAPASCFGGEGMEALAERLVFDTFGGKRISAPFYLSTKLDGGFRFAVVDGLFASPEEARSAFGMEVAEYLGEFAAKHNAAVLALAPSEELAAGSERVGMSGAFAWQGVLAMDVAGCSPAGPGALRFPPDWPLFRLNIAVPGDPFIKYSPVSLRRRDDGVFTLR